MKCSGGWAPRWGALAGVGQGPSHRIEAVRAHLLERAGEPASARAAYLKAARMTASEPEQRYLTLRAAALSPDPSGRCSRVRVSGGPPLPPETAPAGGSQGSPKPPPSAATPARQAHPSDRWQWAL